MRFRAYVVVPYLPLTVAKKVDWDALRPHSRRSLPRAPLTRGLEDHQRVVRESLVHTDNIVSDLEALELSARLLSGPEVAELLFRRFNPSSSGTGYLPRLEVLGELDELGDARAAAAAAAQLREQIAASPVDLDDSRFIRVEQDLERVLYVSSIPDFTEFGWLLQAMEIDRPFALTVHVHALDRRLERRKARNRRRRLHAHQHRRRDPRQGPRRGHARPGDRDARAARRAPRPPARRRLRRRDLPGRARARPAGRADAACRGLRARRRGDPRRHRRRRQVRRLHAEGPVALDAAARPRRRAPHQEVRQPPRRRHRFPCVGPSCGSPTGLPFFFAEGVRTLENLDPWDRIFVNGLMLANGLQGSGKTMFGSSPRPRLLPYGVNVTVLDRSGHWEPLTRLVPGAAHLSIGAGDSHATINPWDVPDLRRVGPEKIAFLRDLHELLVGDHHAGL